MNSLLGRSGPSDARGDDAGSPPDEPPERGHGGGRGGGRPARVRWLPWLVLGGALIAVERAAMFAFTVPGGTPARYGTAAATLIVVWVSGVLVGGVAFARAWHRARRP